MKEILAEAIALLGKDVVLAHAKDLDHDGDAGDPPAGYGARSPASTLAPALPVSRAASSPWSKRRTPSGVAVLTDCPVATKVHQDLEMLETSDTVATRARARRALPRQRIPDRPKQPSGTVRFGQEVSPLEQGQLFARHPWRPPV